MYQCLIESGCGVVAVRSQEELGAVVAEQRLVRLPAIPPGACLLRRVRIASDPGGRRIEYAAVHDRSDRFALTLDLRRESLREDKP